MGFNRRMLARRSLLSLAVTLSVLDLAASVRAAPATTEATPDPGQARQKTLTELFLRLRQAPDPEVAAHLRPVIIRLMTRSDSPTAKLLMARAESLLHAGKGTEAAALLDRIVLLYPDWTLGWRRRAQAALLQGDNEGAMLDLDRALSIEPRDFLAMTELSTLLRGEGRDGPALDLLRRILAIDPQNLELQRDADQLERKVDGQKI